MVILRYLFIIKIGDIVVASYDKNKFLLFTIAEMVATEFGGGV